MSRDAESGLNHYKIFATLKKQLFCFYHESLFTHRTSSPANISPFST